jgi:hypothetical protein
MGVFATNFTARHVVDYEEPRGRKWKLFRDFHGNKMSANVFERWNSVQSDTANIDGSYMRGISRLRRIG